MDHRVTVVAGKEKSTFRIRLPKGAPQDALDAAARDGLAKRVLVGTLPADAKVESVAPIVAATKAATPNA